MILPKIKILIADDNRSVIAILRNALGMENDIDIISAVTDGFQAVENTYRLHPDVVLMDISMPGCDGLEALRMIHKDLPDQKVVLLTVSTSLENLRIGLRYGAQGYLVKSDPIYQLADSIRQTHRGFFTISITMVKRLIEESQQNMDEWESRDTVVKKVLSLIAGGLEKEEVVKYSSQTPYQIESILQNYLAEVRNQINKEVFIIR